MLKARFGDDVANKLSANLEVKATESRKDNKNNKRRGDKKDRAPRQQKDRQ
jgi:hypothetical protein